MCRHLLVASSESARAVDYTVLQQQTDCGVDLPACGAATSLSESQARPSSSDSCRNEWLRLESLELTDSVKLSICLPVHRHMHLYVKNLHLCLLNSLSSSLSVSRTSNVYRSQS